MNEVADFYSTVRTMVGWARALRKYGANYHPTEDERRAISDLSTELGFLARELEDAA